MNSGESWRGMTPTRNYSKRTLVLWRRESLFVLLGTGFLVLAGVTAMLTHPRYPDVGPSVILIGALFACAVLCLVLVLYFMVRTLVSVRKDRRTGEASMLSSRPNS